MMGKNQVEAMRAIITRGTQQATERHRFAEGNLMARITNKARDREIAREIDNDEIILEALRAMAKVTTGARKREITRLIAEHEITVAALRATQGPPKPKRERDKGGSGGSQSEVRGRGGY